MVRSTFFFEGWASANTGLLAEGLGNMHRGVELPREQNVLMFDGLLKIALAEAETAAGDPERALAIFGDALSKVERTGYRAFEADLQRARGDILLKRDPADPGPARRGLPDGHRYREATRRSQL